MAEDERIERVFHLAQPGDRILVEYSSDVPVSRLVWGKINKHILQNGDPLLVFDFYGVGDILFRNYVRHVEGREYKKLIESKRNIYVFKIGPGSTSYGEIVGQEKVHGDPENFLKAYYSMIQRSLSLPRKPRYSIIFGLSEYLYFLGSTATFNILNALATLPIEDWITIVPINVEIITERELALLRELSSWIVSVKKDGGKIIKGGIEFEY